MQEGLRRVGLLLACEGGLCGLCQEVELRLGVSVTSYSRQSGVFKWSGLVKEITGLGKCTPTDLERVPKQS